MTNKELIEQINNFNYIKQAKIEVEKISFVSSKSKYLRKIIIKFKNQKYPCKVGVNYFMSDNTQTSPLFIIGVDENEESFGQRLELSRWLFSRFWIWLKNIDGLYNMLVNGEENDALWTIEEFSTLINNGWYIQYYNLKELFELKFKPNEMIQFFNEDMNDELYFSDVTKIEFSNDEFIPLTEKETKEKTKMMIQF